jgi:hypothetical protein
VLNGRKLRRRRFGMTGIEVGPGLLDDLCKGRNVQGRRTRLVLMFENLCATELMHFKIIIF